LQLYPPRSAAKLPLLLTELQRLKDKHKVTPKVGIYLHGFNNDYQDSINELFDLEISLEMAKDYANLPGNVVVVDARIHTNKESIKGYEDRKKNQVSVHSSHRYHKRIMADVVQAISSIDRDQIKDREPYEVDGQPMSNHFKLT